MAWLNPPPDWRAAEGALHVTTGDRTDFWRGTFYGFYRDDGHLCAATAAGDFTATVDVAGAYETLYDQAGLMLRLSETHWIKAGIELTDGRGVFSTVVTRGLSDWATMPLDFPPDRITLRLSRLGGAVRVDVRHPDGRWILQRLTDFPAEGAALVGPMCCSPERAGFRATFRDFRLGPPIPRTLHDEDSA
jgi:hypothetical protein